MKTSKKEGEKTSTGFSNLKESLSSTKKSIIDLSDKITDLEKQIKKTKKLKHS